MTELEKIIIHKLEEEKLISFEKFMDLALYYPTLGYYNSPDPKIGREGDFFTSPDINPLFGEMIAKRIAEELIKLKKHTQSFEIVEFGAGKGLLAHDILKYFQRNHPQILEVTNYYIIDISPSLIDLQKQKLSELNLKDTQIHWLKDLDELNRPINGCILSNELIDAFPVHLVKQTQSGLKEVYVAYDKIQKEWSEVLMTPPTPQLEQYLDSQKVQLVEGQKAEINLAALKWLETVASNLKRGIIITIDYGFKAEELYADFRYNGTLVCYKKHQLIDNPYLNIGNQDITSHVNFTALINKGEQLKLKCSTFSTQSKFLLDMGIMETVSQMSADPQLVWQAGIAAKKLIMPGGMGDTFKVLIQDKYPAS